MRRALEIGGDSRSTRGSVGFLFKSYGFLSMIKNQPVKSIVRNYTEQCVFKCYSTAVCSLRRLSAPDDEVPVRVGNQADSIQFPVKRPANKMLLFTVKPIKILKYSFIVHMKFSINNLRLTIIM